MFSFWIEDLDKLIKLELGLMDKLMKMDRRRSGIMAKKIPQLHGCKNLKTFREYLIKQYKETKFSFNKKETEFIKKANIGAHIKFVLIEIMSP